jgi:hypothetical protein
MTGFSKRKRDSNPDSRPPRSTTIYQHEPLPSTTSIRLIELQPGEGTGIIKCQIAIVERDHAPPYEALSYAWGSETDSKVIKCENQKLKVTTNLRDALYTLRHPYNVKMLWADAICINQNDINERGYQVGQMSQIYASAVRVLVWLNLPKSKVHSFEDMFNVEFETSTVRLHSSVNRASQLLQKHVARLEDPNFRVEDMDSDIGLITTAFGQLFESPWFTRLWVVQEVGMAKSVVAMIGDATINFVDLIRFIIRLEKRTLLMDQLGLFIAGKANVFTTFPARSRELSGEVDDDWDFLELMEVTRAQKASDPRDYVYALLGHPCASIQCIPIMQPSYNKSVNDVFFEVAMKMLDLDGSLRMLSAVHHHKEDSFNKKVQTWIPEWSRDAYVLSLGVYRDHLYDVTYDASAGLPSKWELVSLQRSLRVHGFIFGTVDECIQTVEPAKVDGVAVQKQMEKLLIAVFMFKKRQTHSPSENLSDQGQTITAGFRNDSPKQFTADFAAFRIHLMQEAHIQDPTIINSLAPEGKPALKALAKAGSVDEIYWAATRFCMGRTLFSTQSRMIGLGPRILCKGDVCCVLFGAPVPFVLRPVEEGFRLVGEAYVHGVMKGEAVVDWLLAGRYEERAFELL